jgi:hypothetical protein
MKLPLSGNTSVLCSKRGLAEDFYREMRQDVISLGVRLGANVAATSALAPFRSQSPSQPSSLNLFHRLPEPAAFFRACERILKLEGRAARLNPMLVR